MEVGHKAYSQKKPEQLVYLELGGGNGGMLLAIAEDGFRFRSVSPVRANGAMPFAFTLDGNYRLEGSGVIEWVEEDGKSGAMRFTEISPEFRCALSEWLSADSARHSPRREDTPAAATPLDTMEKIRQELRSGYPQRPPKGPAELKIPEKESQRGVPDRTAKPIICKQEFECDEPHTAKRLFPLPVPSSSESFAPAITTSAFLKPAHEIKAAPAAADTAARHASAPPVVTATPSPRVAPVAAAPVAAFIAPASRPPALVPVAPGHTPVPAQPRPYIPPLEESFEHAWERAKLSAPPESARVSRAAAGGIIAIALAVILGALGYNFRQDIGGIFIQMGQSISGDNPAATASPARETKTDNSPSDEQNAAQKSQQPAANSPDGAESGNAAKPTPASPNETAASGAGAATTGTKTVTQSPDGAPNSGSVAAPLSGKPADGAASQLPVAAATKDGAPADTGTGQEEFNSAREILRGSSRERELPRAVGLLWAGVKKGYVPAEVTLADLFRRGDGVDKNCDQARVLLVAASKKGSLDARQMLELMAERGCE